MEDCIFCKIVNKEVPADIIYEDDNFMGFLDMSPAVEKHTLVIPKNHYKTILDMPSSLGNEMLEAIKKISFKLIEKEKAEGFNVVFNVNKIAGQEVDHVHAHIIPRKADDGCRLKLVGGLRDKKK